jgi:hypothetical protein
VAADGREFYRKMFNGIPLVSKQKTAPKIFRFPNEFLAEYYLVQTLRKYVQW